METIIFSLLIALLAIILIIIVFKFAMKQRDKEIAQKEKILDKEH